ncbi:MAG: hypothetical protein SGPRY_004877, partial [Prymnesium sp.]
DIDGSTPLHHAVRHDDAETVVQLLNAAPAVMRRELLTMPLLTSANSPSSSPRVGSFCGISEVGCEDEIVSMQQERRRRSSLLLDMLHTEPLEWLTRRGASGDSPLGIAAADVRGKALEAIMRCMPHVWQDEEEIELLQVCGGEGGRWKRGRKGGGGAGAGRDGDGERGLMGVGGGRSGTSKRGKVGERRQSGMPAGRRQGGRQRDREARREGREAGSRQGECQM